MNKKTVITSQFLQQISAQQWSGCLIVSEPKDLSVSWKLLFDQGQLYYATSAIGQQERLSYLWQELKPNFNLPALDSAESEYQQLASCFSQSNLPKSEFQQLVKNFTQEALIHVLSIEQTSVESISNPLNSEVTTSFSWLELTSNIKTLIGNWQQLNNLGICPFSRINLQPANAFQFYKLLKSISKDQGKINLLNCDNLSPLVELLSQKYCLYQLAVTSGIEPLLIIEQLQPFIAAKLIEILPWQTVEANLPSQDTPSTNKPNRKIESPNYPQQQQQDSSTSNPKAVIACIDDSKTVQRQVKMTLESVGYEVISITESTNALRGLAHRQPALILMDINMPNINGYDLCSMLRRSQKFQDIPIVMLTGRDGIIDRMRAKFVGATNYLTKPFQPEQLITLVQELSVPVTSA